MIYENYRDTIEAARVLGIHDPLIPVLETQLPRLDPILIGDSGQIKEYREETTYGSIGEPHHRHLSQLLGLYPGQLINSTTPAWLAAAKVSLEGRGLTAGTPGWAVAQRLATWARTGDGNQAYVCYHTWQSNHAMYNLWNNHRDSTTTKLFQVDGNFGVTAGVGEMLLQSHEEVVAPLAALPKAWPKGSYRGLLARGAFEVSANWSNGHADRFEILSRTGGPLKLRYPGIAGATVRTSSGKSVTFKRVDNADISFDTKAGETYVLTAIP
jgi:alpha-L-fucosidase 2